ncbi:MAG: ABC transporter ATP-binding protein [Pararhodobacter sp.]|nr:ABC transporter ATP-binding protein [Pararhodobacter sp.]
MIPPHPGPATADLLRVQGLTIALPRGADRPHAVEDVSFSLAAGRITCIVGESGSGKSMTANAIMGLLPAPHVRVTQGQITLQGRPLVGAPEPALRRMRGAEVAMIFQEPMSALNPVMTVGDQIAEVLRKTGRQSRTAERARITELLAAMGLPEPERLQDSYPFRLSGGQRQRVMIAMALALEPALLIAAEPTTALDVPTQKQILALILEQQRSRGLGVMFITHDFGVVAEIADDIVVMEQGRIVEQGPAAQVLNAPRHPYTRKLIAAVPDLAAHAGDPGDPGGETPLLQVQGARRTFVTGGGLWRKGREVKALRDVSLTLNRGEILGVVGESGSGKSTLARSIIGLSALDGGRVLLDGKPIVDPAALLRHRPDRRIQMVFQDPYGSLNPRRTVRATLTMGPIQHGVPRRQANNRAAEMLGFVGLDPSALDRYPHEFSGGQRQRIGIARALVMQPDLLIADEAVSALDVSVQKQVLALLDTIRREMGIAILFVTHDLRVAATICHRILVMRAGEVVEHGETGAIFRAPAHPYTRALLDAVPGKGWQKPELSALEETA